ncbi:tol-pal system protein YbgF [Rhodobacteraceae bacterium KMM 6894]|nr:tol-pal system protein YbgF [Rhodobacteraceae bacterium KMM 6894]
MTLLRLFTPAVLAVLLLSPAAAQTNDETLADIRQELTVLHVEVQKLKRELSTTGSASQLGASGSVIDRVAAIEGEVQRLTGKTEDLELRLNRVVTDGTNRIGDLEFRLVELEGGDVSSLGETTTLGGGVAPAVGATGSAIQSADTPVEQMAVGEQADFDAAEAALSAGNYAEAATLFASFQTNYPGGPLAGQAALKRGQALEGAGDTTQAARAYLETFSAAPKGPVAADALFHLGQALGNLGQKDEACLTLSEVAVRFPGSAAEGKAAAAKQTLGCS